jgi:hypothetical protein
VEAAFYLEQLFEVVSGHPYLNCLNGHKRVRNPFVMILCVLQIAKARLLSESKSGDDKQADQKPFSSFIQFTE